jgi:hypothetical protein
MQGRANRFGSRWASRLHLVLARALVCVLAPLWLTADLGCQRANPAFHPLADAAAGNDGGDASPGSDAGAPCTGAEQQSCYAGPAGTAGVGVCRAGIQSCIAGAWSRCVGQVTPTGEACNGQDDDCNGAVDDRLGMFTCGLGACQKSVAACAGGVPGVCVADTGSGLDQCDGVDNNCNGAIDEDCDSACVHVSQDGNDNNADGSQDNPFRTIQSAITWSAADANRPKNVCVAGGRSCTDTTTYQSPDNATITMSSGVSLYGNYESTTWTRCALASGGALAPRVTIEPHAASGIVFPATVTAPTGLDGFRITRVSLDTGTVAAVTVTGAKQVTLSNLLIDDTPAIDSSYGVDLTGGAQALITRCSILGGTGASQTIGVRSVGSRPTIRENCATLDPDTGRCTAACPAATSATAGAAAGIRGRITAATGGGGPGAVTTPSTSDAVYLEGSTTGASVETSTLCGTEAQAGAALRITGAPSGAAAGDRIRMVIRGNTISAAGGTVDSHGVWVDECSPTAPWIVANELIEAQGAGRAAGVRAVGACAPVIDGNIKITGGAEGTVADARGVSCEADTAGAASLCAVLGNTLIQGSSTDRAATAAGVACDDGSCARIAGNTVSGNLGGDVAGVSLRASGPLVERNQITAGCGLLAAAGLFADDAFARIENNLISGGGCDPTAGGLTPTSAGLQTHEVDGPNELDVNGNTIDGAGAGGACTSLGVEYGVGSATPPTTSKGIFRNNIIRAGLCAIAYDFAEEDVAADPRIFENNDLDPTGPSTALYLDENMTALEAVSALSGLAGLTASGNISADPLFMSYPTDLQPAAGSPCLAAGTPTGAPAVNFNGDPRDPAHPNIGAY